MDAGRIQGLVDELLLREGCFRPVDFLSASGRLPGRALRDWRNGRLDYLEDALAGNPDRIDAWLDQAHDWARQLGLKAELQPPAARGRYARHPGRDRLLRTRWTRQNASDQMDLFADSRVTMILGRLRKALAQGRTDTAESELHELYATDPDHGALGEAEALLECLHFRARPVDDPAAAPEWLETMEIRARDFLGEEADAFMAPAWRHLAEFLDTHGPPENHRARALFRAGEWQRVVAAVRATRDRSQHPELLRWMARSAAIVSDKPALTQAVDALCADHPEAALDWLDSEDEPRLRTLADDFFDLDESPEIAWFPAWIRVRGAAANPETLSCDQGTDSGARPESSAEAPPRLACRLLDRIRTDPRDAESLAGLKQASPMVHGWWVHRKD